MKSISFDVPLSSVIGAKGSESVHKKTTGNERLKIIVILTPFVILKKKIF